MGLREGYWMVEILRAGYEMKVSCWEVEYPLTCLGRIQIKTANVVTSDNSHHAKVGM